jgi:integrase/recombinase XerC
MHITHYFEGFKEYLSYEKRYSAHTIRAYTDDLIQFSDFLQIDFETQDLHAIKASMVRTWLAKMKDNQVTAKTINRKISTLKTYYKYLQRKEVVTVSPLIHISAPKITKRLPQYVEQGDIRTLFQHVAFADGYTGALQRIIMALLYYTGMRNAELQNLQTSQVDLYSKSLKVLGKGNKERIIPMVAELQEEIDTFLPFRQNITTTETFFLVNEKGDKLYPKFIYNVVKQYLTLVTTISKRSPHILRHSFATHLTNNGAELNAVKELLGHASLAATQIYTHNSIEKLKTIHKKAHPKA